MSVSLLILAVAASFSPPAGSDCARIRVIDGDTISCDGEHIRLLDIEAPEMKGSSRCRRPAPRDWCDYRLAILSRDTLADFLRSGPVRISRGKLDRYGRTLGRLTVNGRDAGRFLISVGMAREYR